MNQGSQFCSNCGAGLKKTLVPLSALIEAAKNVGAEGVQTAINKG